MIVDYYIDFAGLVKSFSDRQTRNHALSLFSRLIDICSNENGRLVIDEEQSVLAPLEEFRDSKTNMGGLFSSSLTLVLSRFFWGLPEKKTILLIGGNKIYCNKAYDEANDKMLKLAVRIGHDRLDLENMADIVIAPPARNGNKRFASIEDAFVSKEGLEAERLRAKYRDLLTFGFDKVDLISGKGDAGRFKCAINAFGRAELSCFEIFDPYCFRLSNCPDKQGCAEFFVPLLFRWIKLMLGGVPRAGILIKVFSTTKYMEELGNDRIATEAKNILMEALQEEWNRAKSEIGKQELPLKIKLHVTKYDTNSEIYKWMHDRRICSSSHSFSIGGGLDVLNERHCMFEIHYCGRRGYGSQTEEPRLKKIREFFESSKSENAFVHEFALN